MPQVTRNGMTFNVDPSYRTVDPGGYAGMTGAGGDYGLDTSRFTSLMQSTPEFLKSQWMDIEDLARQGGIDQDQFRLLYRKAYNADPDQGVLQTLFGTQGPEA